MKKIIFVFAATLAGLSFQSCSLHEETDLFGKSAAERVEEAISSDKQLLESASNGWKLTYYTGQEYEGGGYTYLCKFHDGSATVSGDMAGGKADSTCTSSYNIINDQSPVLTFDTHNPLMHKFGTPNSSSISGDEGDYEFVIMKTTNDSIYLKGKKWGNKMVMTRMPEGLSWEEHLDSINKVASGIYYNNTLKYGDELIAHVDIDDYTRRATFKFEKAYQFAGESFSEPYVVTSKGIHLLHPMVLKEEEIQDFVFDEDTHELKPANSASGNFLVEGYLPENYKFIDFFEGTWNIICHAVDAENKETQTEQQYRVEFTYYSPIYLKGKININGLPFDLYFQYHRDKGGISLVQQYADDPSKTYAYANVAPVCFAKGGRFNWSGDFIGNWIESEKMVKFKSSKDPKEEEYPIDSYVFLATNSAGSPVYDSNGALISLASLTYIQGMTKVK